MNDRRSREGTKRLWQKQTVSLRELAVRANRHLTGKLIGGTIVVNIRQSGFKAGNGKKQSDGARANAYHVNGTTNKNYEATAFHISPEHLLAVGFFTKRTEVSGQLEDYLFWR